VISRLNSVKRTALPLHCNNFLHFFKCFSSFLLFLYATVLISEVSSCLLCLLHAVRFSRAKVHRILTPGYTFCSVQWCMLVIPAPGEFKAGLDSTVRSHFKTSTSKPCKFSGATPCHLNLELWGEIQ
jgi:hypothetical protein